MYQLPPSVPTRLKQTHETVDCWEFSGEHAHLQSNNKFFLWTETTKYIFSKCEVRWCVPKVCVCIVYAWTNSSCQPPIPRSRWDDDPVCDARRRRWKWTKSEYLLAGKNGRMDFLLDLGVQVTKKNVVPRFIQDKIRIGSLIYRPDRRRRASQTGSSSHRKPGIGGCSWQLELVQAYTMYTHFWHTPSHFALRENVFSCLCPKKEFIVWLKMGMFAQKYSTINRFMSLL